MIWIRTSKSDPDKIRPDPQHCQQLRVFKIIFVSFVALFWHLLLGSQYQNPSSFFLSLNFLPSDGTVFCILYVLKHSQSFSFNFTESGVYKKQHFHHLISNIHRGLARCLCSLYKQNKKHVFLIRIQIGTGFRSSLDPDPDSGA